MRYELAERLVGCSYCDIMMCVLMELSADVFMTELQLAVRIRGFLICKYIVRMSSFFGCKIVFLFVTR